MNRKQKIKVFWLIVGILMIFSMIFFTVMPYFY